MVLSFRSTTLPAWIILSFLSGLGSFAWAADVANLYSAQGSVEKRLAAASAWTPAATGTRFEPGHSCQTGPNSRAAVLFVDGVLIRMNEATVIDFKTTASTSQRAPIGIGSGSTYFFSREPRRFPQIQTPIVSAAVRGTEFVVQVTPNQTIISVLEGELECWNAFNDANRLQVFAGEEAVTVAGAAPVKRIMVQPWDAVQWALYYPAVLDAAELAQLGFPDANAQLAVEQSVTAYQRGDLLAAFAALAALPEPKPLVVDLYQSALFLAVGQVEKAEALLGTLDQSLAAAPADMRPGLRAISQSQRSIIALINNRGADALLLAREAVAASDRSGAAALALSYAEQGRFNLKEARRWVERALTLHPQSATVRARLAELQLGFGQLNQAVRTVEEGLASTRDDSRLLTVAGFAYLTRYETPRAIGFFRRAIQLDDAAGLPHLGLGLALIRQNELQAGRRELEIAVHLEPRDSLMRSYLGKAFFEEKRDHLAQVEYDLARQFDPLDPTPYLYRAFYKLGNYRPVEALWDLEDSIRLNDNRAVYRSRLLLDQDQAVRSVGLSQVFNQIGFVEAGRVEAIKSINRDYGNFSAHLLLSGSYFERPQLNRAVITEQLVTRLLAPVNINSVRGEASFNEYSSLFDRQRMQFFLLSEGRSAEDFIQGAPRVTAAGDRMALAFVYGMRYQGGYRRNDEATLLAPGFLAQVQVTPDDTLSLETVQFDLEEGDSAIRFNPNTNDPDLERELESITQRIGWHHRFGPGSHLIGQFLYLHRDQELQNVTDFATFPGLGQVFENQEQKINTTALRGDMQHIWDNRWLSLVSGASWLEGEDRKRESSLYVFTSSGLELARSSQGTTPANSQRAYLYGTWHLGDRIDFTTGAAYGRVEFSELSGAPFDDARTTREAIDPKFGIVARMTRGTTVRAAYYETLGGSGDADLESIEPTQVAGLNQLFDDPVAAQARGAAIGLDQKFAKWTYGGVEGFQRDLERPLGIFQRGLLVPDTPNTVFTLQARERGIRGYAYQVLHRTTTATFEYTLLEREDDTSELADLTDDQSLTHRLRLGVNYFNPRGWFAGLTGTWRYQELKDFEPAADGATDGFRDFWILDATLGYQLPKRTGYVALSFNNLLDRDFRYQPVGIDHRFLPDFSVNTRLFLTF